MSQINGVTITAPQHQVFAALRNVALQAFAQGVPMTDIIGVMRLLEADLADTCLKSAKKQSLVEKAPAGFDRQNIPNGQNGHGG